MKRVQIMPLGPIMALPRGHMFILEKHGKIFLSETIRPRVFIFGM